MASPAKTPPIPVPGPAKLAGVQSQKAPESQAPKPKYPQDLGNGDVLLAEIDSFTTTEGETIKSTHKAKIINKTDSSQKFPYLVECSCGHQGRMFTEKHAREHAENHIALRFSRGA